MNAVHRFKSQPPGGVYMAAMGWESWSEQLPGRSVVQTEYQRMCNKWMGMAKGFWVGEQL